MFGGGNLDDPVKSNFDPKNDVGPPETVRNTRKLV